MAQNSLRPSMKICPIITPSPHLNVRWLRQWRGGRWSVGLSSWGSVSTNRTTVRRRRVRPAGCEVRWSCNVRDRRESVSHSVVFPGTMREEGHFLPPSSGLFQEGFHWSGLFILIKILTRKYPIWDYVHQTSFWGWRNVIMYNLNKKWQKNVMLS